MRGFDSFNPIHSIKGESTSGKSHDFDSCMRRFESCLPYQFKLNICEGLNHGTNNI